MDQLHELDFVVRLYTVAWVKTFFILLILLL